MEYCDQPRKVRPVFFCLDRGWIGDRINLRRIWLQDAGCTRPSKSGGRSRSARVGSIRPPSALSAGHHRPPARRPGPPAPPAGPARRRPRPLSPFPAAPPARRTRLEAALLAGGRARPPAGPLPRSSARRCPNPRGGRGCGGGSKGKLVRFCLPSGLRFTGS